MFVGAQAKMYKFEQKPVGVGGETQSTVWDA